MQLIRTLFLVAVLGALSACAEVKIAKENTMATPKAGKAIVYFYRESHFQGWAAAYNIWENETTPHKLGSLGNGTYFYTYLAPGKYTFYVNGEVRGATTVDVKAGNTYYLQNRIDMGFWAGRPKLTEVTENEGMKQLQNGELKMAIADTSPAGATATATAEAPAAPTKKAVKK